MFNSTIMQNRFTANYTNHGAHFGSACEPITNMLPAVSENVLAPVHVAAASSMALRQRHTANMSDRLLSMEEFVAFGTMSMRMSISVTGEPEMSATATDRTSVTGPAAA